VSRADGGETYCEIEEADVDRRDGSSFWRVPMRDLRAIVPGLAVPVLQVRRLRPDAVLPRRMSERAAGLDLCAVAGTPIWIEPGRWVPVGTGIGVAIAPGYEGQVRPRSGLARDHGVTVLNAPGTIDADYRGEVIVLLVNHGERPVVIDPGERIAQLVICPVVFADPVEVEALPPTSRGTAGFGSTGR
jgi:dUTP pyrophosphatase